MWKFFVLNNPKYINGYRFGHNKIQVSVWLTLHIGACHQICPNSEGKQNMMSYDIDNHVITTGLVMHWFSPVAWFLCVVRGENMS